jgi:GNAT superfamily N-acetyltransferase
MAIEVVPATIDRFNDLAVMLGPKPKPDASVCWCLSHRLASKTDRQLVGTDRGEYVKTLCGTDQGPGVLAYDDGQVVGWAAAAPRAELPFARSRRIPHVDELPVWSVWCLRVRPGRRGRGISRALLAGAGDYAARKEPQRWRATRWTTRARRSMPPWPTSGPGGCSNVPGSPRRPTRTRCPVGSRG